MSREVSSTRVLTEFFLAYFDIFEGIPIIFKFDKDMKPLPPTKEESAVTQIHSTGRFLEKPGVLKEAMKREAEWAA